MTVISGQMGVRAYPATKHGEAVLRTYAHMPLCFEENRGQTDATVDFLGRGDGYNLFLTPQEAVFCFTSPHQTGRAEGRQATLRLRLSGGNTNAPVRGSGRLPTKTSYFHGNIRSDWRHAISSFQSVRYAGVYPGIDLVYYGNRRRLEYDFVVGAHADPRPIRLDFLGARRIRIDQSGNLVVGMDDGNVLWKRPKIYQKVDGRRIAIKGNYVRRGLCGVGFKIARYNRSQPLVIDPILVYSTYLGGSGSSVAYSVAMDAAGNAYVAGTTAAADFPVTTGAFQPHIAAPQKFDAFVAKIDPSGTSLQYSTFIGGDGNDGAYGIAVDKTGSAFLSGETISSNFPVTAHAFQRKPGGGSAADAFACKLSPDGTSLLYATYLGGSGNDYANAIAVDEAGNAYVTGATDSQDFPVTVGAAQKSLGTGAVSNAFVVEIDPSGSAELYGSYLGGGNYDGAYGIAVDAAGHAYVVGIAYSQDFPTTTGALQTSLLGGYDAFIAKFDMAKVGATSLIYSSLLGGSGGATAYAIAVDTGGQAYVTGSTTSADFPITPNAFQPAPRGAATETAYVAKMNATGSALIYSTYLGGGNTDYGYGICLDVRGDAVVTGNTVSADFPVTARAVQATYGGGDNGDAFVAVLNPSGTQLLYGAYLGGNGSDIAYGIAADKYGNAVVVGQTTGDMPTNTGAFQPQYPGGNTSGFVTKVHFDATPTGIDMNGDGLPDMLLQSQKTGDVVYALLNGTAATKFGYLFQGIASDWQIVGAMDIDGDGQPDLLWQNRTTGDIAYILLKNGIPGQFGVLFHGVGLDWHLVGTADLNGDGKTDLLFQNARTGDVSYTLMNGPVALLSGYLFQNIDPNWRIVGTPDLDGDGSPDLLWQHGVTGIVAYHLMRGVTPKSFGVLFSVGDTLWHIVGVSDFGVSGDTNVVFEHQKTGAVSYTGVKNLLPANWGYIFQGVAAEWSIVGER